MDWVHAPIFIALFLRTVLPAPTNTEDIISAGIKTEKNVHITTSENKDSDLKDDPKNGDLLEVKLLKTTGNTQYVVNTSSINQKDLIDIEKEELKDVKLSEVVEEVIESGNSSVIVNYTLKSAENIENNTLEGTKTLISSLAIENDDSDPIEVLDHLNKLLMDTEDFGTLKEVKSELANYLNKLKNRSKNLSVQRVYDKAKAAITVPPSIPPESGAFTFIKDVASVAGHFLGSLIKVPFKVFDTVKKSFSDGSSYNTHHEPTPQGPSGSLRPSTPNDQMKSISLYCISLSTCIDKIVF